jgi:serine/threonine-protein kinase RsbW
MRAPAGAHDDEDFHSVPARLRIQVPGRLDAITPAVERIMAEARGMECARGKEFEVETSVREALSNAIRHGCRNDETKVVEIVVACEPAKGMLVVVRDPGPGFDPAKVPSPTSSQNIFRHHGRGIYLINQLMDEVSFEGNGNEIRMKKR